MHCRKIIPSLRETLGRASVGIAANRPSASGHCAPSAAQLMAALNVKTLGFRATTCATCTSPINHGDWWENLQKPWLFYVLLTGSLMKWEYLFMGSPCFLAETKSTMPRSSKTKKKC